VCLCCCNHHQPFVDKLLPPVEQVYRSMAKYMWIMLVLVLGSIVAALLVSSSSSSIWMMGICCMQLAAASHFCEGLAAAHAWWCRLPKEWTSSGSRDANSHLV
jgi:hypothetical protein